MPRLWRGGRMYLKLKFPSFKGDTWACRGIFDGVCHNQRKSYQIYPQANKYDIQPFQFLGNFS